MQFYPKSPNAARCAIYLSNIAALIRSSPIINIVVRPSCSAEGPPRLASSQQR